MAKTTLKDNQLDKKTLLCSIRNARELKSFYDAENKRNPKWHYDYGGVDEIALRQIEKKNGVIVVGIKRNQNRVNMFVIKGAMTDNGEVYYLSNETTTYSLLGYEGTTIARFVTSVCDILVERAGYVDPVLQNYIRPNISASLKTKKGISDFL